MEELLKNLAGHIALGIEVVAILSIAAGSLEAIAHALRIIIARSTVSAMRDVWMRYARWLVAGLTFELGGDIVRSVIAPTWDEIGRLGAIAVIRTFLAYFLAREMAERRQLQREESDAGDLAQVARPVEESPNSG
jgi:uncharacterized membrane protein